MCLVCILMSARQNIGDRGGCHFICVNSYEYKHLIENKLFSRIFCKYLHTHTKNSLFFYPITITHFYCTVHIWHDVSLPAPRGRGVGWGGRSHLKKMEVFVGKFRKESLEDTKIQSKDNPAYLLFRFNIISKTTFFKNHKM